MKSNQLIDEISHYITSGKPASAAEISGFKQEAKNLSRIADSAMVFGMIACLEGDIDECKKQHEKAIFLNQDLEFYLNYYRSLNRLGRLYDAYHCLEQAMLFYPSSAYLFKLTIREALFLGLFDKVVEYYDSLGHLSSADDQAEIQSVVYQAKCGLSMNLAHDALQKLAQILEDISSRHAARVQKVNFILDDDTQHEFFQWIETTANVETTVDMNGELCHTLANTPNLDLGPLTVAFRACQQS